MEESKNKTKLRFCSDFRRKKYTRKENIDFKTAKSIMKLQLNMLELKSNYKGRESNELCDLCGDKNGTTEHRFNAE